MVGEYFKWEEVIFMKLKTLSMVGATGAVALGALAFTPVSTFAQNVNSSTNAIAATKMANVSASSKDKAMVKATLKIDDVANVLGMTRGELMTEHRSGKTLAQIASEHGVTVEQLFVKVFEKEGYSADQAQKMAQRVQAFLDNHGGKLEPLRMKLKAMHNN